MTKTLEVIVSPSGGVEIEAKGYSGAECEKATRALEEALGRKLKDVRTTEYYKGPEQKVQAR